MKNIYTILAFFLFVTSASSQNYIPVNTNALSRPIASYQPPFTAPAERSTSTFGIAYDSADSYYHHQLGHNYYYSIGALNWNYSAAAGDTLNEEKKYAVVAFDSAYDAYNLVGYAQSSYTTIRVDSIYAVVGHENNSGLNDTLIVKILTVDSRGYPTSTVLWEHTIISTDFSPGANWDDFNGLGEIILAPNFVVPSAKRFAVAMEYHGAKIDTFGLIHGFGSFNGPCPGGSIPLAYQTNFSTIISSQPPPASFKANSMVLWSKFESLGLLPRPQSGLDLYYDCNGNGIYEPGIDGANYIQDWLIRTTVTIDPLTAIEEQNMKSGIRLLQNVPNPIQQSSTIGYELAKQGSIMLTLYDVTQRKVAVLDEGSKPAGKHTVVIDSGKFSEGLYFYTLSMGDVSLTRKMIISR